MEDNTIKEQEPLPKDGQKPVEEEKTESEVIAKSAEKPKTTRRRTPAKSKTDGDSSEPTEKKPRTRKASSASGSKKSSSSTTRKSKTAESAAEAENTEKVTEAIDALQNALPIEENASPSPEIELTVPESVEIIEAPVSEAPLEAVVDTDEKITESEIESSIDESEIVAESESVEDESEEAIIPPDELFAYRAKPAIEPEEVEQEVLEEVQEATLAPEEEGVASEEGVDEDGQYQFTDLEPMPSQTEEKTEPKLEKYDPKKPRSIDKRFDLVELFVFTLLAVMIITTFFFRHSIVDGDSMVDTLHNGEHLIISDFFYTPKRGDIIVCEDYSTSLKKPIVKRVIAIEGDTIEIKSGQVRVNGKLLDESDYLYIDGIDVTKPVSLTVPENEIFVMGDHRNDSEDSRSIGTISEDAVLGKVILRFYPFDKFGPVN